MLEIQKSTIIAQSEGETHLAAQRQISSIAEDFSMEAKDVLDKISLIDEAFITLPDMACLPKNKTTEEIKRGLQEGFVCENETVAAEKALSLVVDIYKHEDLLFHELFYYYGGDSRNLNEQTATSATARGLVSAAYDVIRPIRAVSRQSLMNGPNRISVWDPWKNARFLEQIKTKGSVNFKGNAFRFAVYYERKGGDWGPQHELSYVYDEELGVHVHRIEEIDYTQNIVDTRNVEDNEKFFHYLFTQQALGHLNGKELEFACSAEYRAMSFQELWEQPLCHCLRGRNFFVPASEVRDVSLDELVKRELLHPESELMKEVEQFRDIESYVQKEVSDLRKSLTWTLVIRIDPKIRHRKVASEMSEVMGGGLVYGHVQPWEIIGIILPSENPRAKKDSQEVERFVRSAFAAARQVGIPVYDSDGTVLWPSKTTPGENL